MNRLRGAVATLLLVLLAAAGVLVALGAVMLVVSLGTLEPDRVGDLLRWLLFDAAGWALLATAPAVLALVLRLSHPVASDLLATLIGGVLVLVAGPHAAGSGHALLAALAGLGLVLCALPLTDA